jgi:tetratricopeptide (TPR) repeat protein/CHAT domain-containing protein
MRQRQRIPGGWQGVCAALALLMGWSADARSQPLSPAVALALRAHQQKELERLDKEIPKLYAAGHLVEALDRQQRHLALTQQLFPASSFPNGHADLAGSLNNLGFLLQSKGESGKALPYYEQALAMYRRLYPEARFPQGHPDLAASLHNLGELLYAMGEYGKALPYFEQALAMYRRLYPEARFPQGDPHLARSLNNLGALLQARGEYSKALPFHEQALAMYRRLYPEARFPQGHPDLAVTLHNLGRLLEAMGESGKALPYYEQALAMLRRLYPQARFPQGHPNLAVSLSNLGFLLRDRGEYEKALPYLEQALAMQRLLYPEARFPQGHPDLARSLTNLGFLLQDRGEYGKALPYFEQALAMDRRLYPEARFPQGHPDLATSLNNLGALLQAMGESAKALPYLEQALAMKRRLYREARFPKGHPDLAFSLNNLGLLLQEMGEYEKALSYLEQALAMNRQLYPEARFPQGHPELARSLHNLGVVLQDMGEYSKALPYFEQTLAMSRPYLERELAGAAEAEARALLGSLPRTRDGFLTTTRHVPGSDAQSYAQVWTTKAALARLLQRRHTARRAAQDLAVKADWQALLDVRRQLARLLLNPGLDLTDRDRHLRQLSDRKEALERKLAQALPELPRQQELDRLGPADLIRRLPGNGAFIDLLQYAYWREKSKKPVNARERPYTASYVAFVFAPGRQVVRVELGLAAPINAAIVAWRQALTGWQATLPPAELQQLEDTANRAAARARRLVWEPLAPHLPAGTQTVYLSPDEDLARLPFAALPGSQPGRVLLDDYALAVVPHGPFLLEQLRYPPRFPEGPELVLAVGGVGYDPPGSAALGRGYQPLPGTVAELRQLQAMAGVRPVRPLSGAEASAARLLAELPQARYAHLATHGFFAAAELTAEKQRTAQQVKDWAGLMERQLRDPQARPAAPTERVVSGQRTPLAYTGLVLAGANRPAGAGPEGGIVTGEALVELPLEGLRLAVLSACETGLGELTGGEGVQGLQRAFHLAGCPNVLASLWNVNDQATAALMAVFYHQLWAEKKPPLEALRMAQLTIYRHPERIADLAGERGAPRLKEAVQLPAEAPAAPTRPGGRTPAKLWAAFVLSGLGQ